MASKEFTGRKMLILTVSAFGVIIGVNLILAWQAINTFPGLEVKNSYVASQQFDRERAAQEALGWDVSAQVENGRLVLSIRDRDGRPVQAADLSATVGRATNVAQDQTPELVFDGTAYVAPIELVPGYWKLRLVAVAQDGTKFQQRLEIHVK